jgi:hypothetical protein
MPMTKSAYMPRISAHRGMGFPARRMAVRISGDSEDLSAVTSLSLAAVRTARSSGVTLRFPARTGPLRHAAYCWRHGAGRELEADGLTTGCGGGTLAHAIAAQVVPAASRQVRVAMDITVRDTGIQPGGTPVRPARSLRERTKRHCRLGRRAGLAWWLVTQDSSARFRHIGF